MSNKGVGTIRAPFPWFGGKSLAAPLIWNAFGDVSNYIEPFAGSCATLLSRPYQTGRLHVETVNDFDNHICNVWRAIKMAPDDVVKWAAEPLHEAEVQARHVWLMAPENSVREKVMASPDFFDARVAGYWLYGICSWIGSGWCAQENPKTKLPSLTNKGMGIFSMDRDGDLTKVMLAIQQRLRYVRVTCGDWTRVLSDSCLRNGPTGVLLDPPYDSGAKRLYAAGGQGIAQAVRDWAVIHGDDKNLRIALCGYRSDYVMPKGWTEVAWTAGKAYNKQASDFVLEERIFFSPYCLKQTGGAALDIKSLFNG